MSKIVTVLIALSIAQTAAAGLTCHGFFHGRGHKATKIYPLAPMKQDATLLSAKVGDFSFVVDTVELTKNGSLRLFIHDLKADYTAMSDGVMKKIGSQRESRLQQIIGYETSEPMTVGLNCYL